MDESQGFLEKSPLGGGDTRTDLGRPGRPQVVIFRFMQDVQADEEFISCADVPGKGCVGSR